MASDLTRYLGTLQGVLVPQGRAAPPDADALGLGEYAVVFGSDLPNIVGTLDDGDTMVVVQILQAPAAPRVRYLYSLDLRTPLPAGWEWRERVFVGGIDIERPLAGGLPTPLIRHLRDRAINAAQSLPGDELGFGLVLRKTDPMASAPIEVELPGVWLDAIVDDDPAPLWLANRVPEPDAIAVPHDWPTMLMELHSTSIEAIDLTTLTINVGGVPAVVGGVVVGPFTGSVVVDAPNLLISLDLASVVPVSSGLVPVDLSAETTGGLDTIVEAWSWQWADIVAPALVQAGEATPRTVWVWTNEPLAGDPSQDFVLEPTPGPAYKPTVLSVTLVAPNVLELELDEELTQHVTYTITGTIEDPEGNTTLGTVSLSTGRFRPDDRVVDVFGWFPRYNREADEGGLRVLSAALQDVFERSLIQTDRWLWIFHPDWCDARYLPAILESYGCPWSPDLMTEAQQRRLAMTLVGILQLSGTSPGLVAAVDVLLGIDVTVRTGTSASWWQIGFNFLGVDTVISPDAGNPIWYTFWFDVADPSTLTDDDLVWLDRIANTLRGAHEHYGGVYSLAAPTNIFWTIGVSTLGVDTLIGI